MATQTKQAMNGEAPSPIQLSPLEVQTVDIPIVGVTELITHRWSEKARKQMLDKQTGAAVPKKEPKDPQQEFEQAKYTLPGHDGIAMPATAFKAAITDAARWYENVTMETLKRGVRVMGEGPEQLVPIMGEVRMREDMPRLSGPSRTADLRYRPAVEFWSATLQIQYVTLALSLEALVNLVNAGGMGGVGEWRPSSPRSKTGVYGTFRVAESGPEVTA